MESPMTNCRICDGEELEVIGDGRRWREYAEAPHDPRRRMLEIGLKLGWSLDFVFVRCRDCGFVALDPMPAPDLLRQIYSDYEASHGYGAKQEKKLRRATRRIHRLRRRVASGRFLDVGCNLGYAVEAARRMGYHATGIDLDPAAIDRAQQAFPACYFRADPLEELAQETTKFDLVFCSEVIEHAADVEAFARSLSGTLRPGGLLYLTTPDAGHFRVPRDFCSWSEVKPPEHVCWFTKKALRRLMLDCGVVVERFSFNLKPGLKMLARRAA